MKRILITGLNSYIGNSFENYLRQWPDDYRVDKISLRDDNWKTFDFSGYDAVFHVAGIAHSDRGVISAEKAKLYYRVNTALTAEVAAKAKAEGVPRFMFMSSASVYGESSAVGEYRQITRETPVSPANSYGDSKVQAEKALQKLESDSFRIAIIRAPMIYGKGSKGNYPLLSKMARKLPVFPLVKNQRSMIYVENLVEFLRLMVENREYGIFWPQNEVYTNTSEMVSMIAQAHGRKIWMVPGCTWILKILSCFTGLVNKAFGSLTYEKELSQYKTFYCKKTLAESIKETEEIL